jgi:predicted lipoprotein with Yx(FWY)xxD motif
MKRLLITGTTAVAALAVGIAIAVAATGATVTVKQLGGAGKVLVDSKGKALYMNDQEHGKALCTGACLSFWKPLLATGRLHAGSLPGKLGVVKRPDGGKQVTYNGKLLYEFTLDKSGRVTGDGFKDAFGGQRFTWHVEHAVKTVSRTSTPAPAPYPGY